MVLKSTESTSSLILPISMITLADLGRVVRELEQVDETLHQAGLRKGGEPVSLPKLSRLCNELCEANGVNLLHKEKRQAILKQISDFKDSAPVLNISFSADPSASFLQKLIAWLRQEMHPEMLLKVGLQPSIGAGCVVRTNNKFYDFSMRHLLDEQRLKLIESLDADDEESK